MRIKALASGDEAVLRVIARGLSGDSPMRVIRPTELRSMDVSSTRLTVISHVRR